MPVPESDPRVVYVGAYDLDNRPDSISVASNVRHPLYGTGSYSVDYDIMITHLSEPYTEGPIVRINFDEGYPSQSGESLVIMGFGSIIGGPETGVANPPNEQSRILRSAPTSYVTFEECAVANDPDTGVSYGIGPTQTAVSPHWFCALNTETSTCFGDSGGPVAKENYFPVVDGEDNDSSDILQIGRAHV